MDEKIALETTVHTPKFLTKIIPNRKVAAGATLVVAGVVTLVAAKFLQDRFDVNVVETAVETAENA